MFGHTVITLCLPDKPGLLQRFTQPRRGKSALSTMLLQVMEHMAPSLLVSPAFVHYPWCFAAPAYAIQPKHYVIGAFLPVLQATTVPPVALYAFVSEAGLFNHLNVRDSLPFWLARTLTCQMTAASDHNRYTEIRHWCHLLQRTLTPAHQGRWRGSDEALVPLREGLRNERCDADVETSSEHGVDAMPWMEWPGCIMSGETIWLWRQSRHGKVIESQKLAHLGKPINKV